jgi:hypothetical protein
LARRRPTIATAPAFECAQLLQNRAGRRVILGDQVEDRFVDLSTVESRPI